MPNHKHGRHHRIREEDNNNHHIVVHDNHAQANQHGGHQQHGRAGPNMQQHGPKLEPCCVPTGCRTPEELIDPQDPANAVKVMCNNESCDMGSWMHKDCFDDWEESVLAYLRSCGRARSWSEKQRLQNLWTKKGYDLAFKACDCKCGRGHLRKDLDYVPPPTNDNRRQKRHKKKNDKPMPVVSTNNHKQGYNQNHAHTNNNQHHHHNNNHHHNGNGHQHHGGDSNNQQSQNGNHDANANATTTSVPVSSEPITLGTSPPTQPVPTPVLPAVTEVSPSSPVPTNANGVLQLRMRSCSISSTGSSPPNSASSGSPLSSSPVNGNFLKNNKFFPESPQNCANGGSIFRRRQDLSAFSVLPRYKQNPYNIKMEDEGPHGNDDTRSFLLTTLTARKVTTLRCVLCKDELPVFDRYPLIDGSFFLSPQAYDERMIQVIWEGRIQFLNSVCINCLEGRRDISCAACKRKWDGSTFVFGTMYTYDIFAAMPCCQKRLTCKHCRRAVVDVHHGLHFFSQYSHMITCPYCKANDYHFVRPLGETFLIKASIY